MRISASAVILSLVAATSVFAAPTPVPAYLDKRSVTSHLQALLAKALKSLECDACVAALTGVKDVAYLNKSWALDAANSLCTDLKLEDADVVRLILPGTTKSKLLNSMQLSPVNGCNT